MQKKSNPQSAFFQLRVLAGLFVFLSGVFLALLGFGAFSNAFAQSKVAVAAPAEDGAQFSPADKQGRFVYLIEYTEPGLLERSGSPEGQQLQADAPEVQAQQNLLVAEQATHVQAMDRAVGRSVDVTHHFLVTHSGIAARLTPAEADAVSKLPGVKSVTREKVYQLDTYRGPEFIGAKTIWDGSNVPGGVGSRGQGIVIGMLDSGVVQAHPSFANDPDCGHGVGGAPNKLITALDCSTTDASGLCNGPNPEDTGGHGTHTASTAGGNVVGPTANPPPTPPSGFTEISGVAPCANLRTYKVCPADTCPGADIQAGMNSILLHGDVRVMNFSISGGNDPWNDNDRRKLDLVDANVIVAASAGNTRATIPNPVGAVAHLGPWVMTVAASTHDGDLEARLSATGPGTPPPTTVNVVANRGSASPVGPAFTNLPIRHFTEQPATAEGCTATTPAFPAGFFNGAAALIHRGSCSFTEKITNAFNAGASLVIIRNNQATAISMSTPGQPNIPAYSIEQLAGNALVQFVDANPTTATIDFDPQVQIPGDILANFSLRGPSALTSVTKPDITGPGVNIYAAYVGQGGYAYLSGTSMSSPHLAGAAALVRAVRQTWTAPEVKSAIMMTAKKTGVKNDRVTPWDPDDVGNGRVDLTKAARAGLVMHETGLNFLNANPATGGDPKTLNIPSMRNVQCAPYCQWTRTVRNTRTAPSSWTASTNAASGFNISVSPANFSFTGSLLETQDLVITAVPTSNLTAAVAFGEVVLTENNSQAPAAHMTVSIKGEPLVVSAVSRKTHGTAGPFDINLPLLGNSGIESRIGPVAGTHQIVVTFTSPVALTGASVVEGTGTAAAVTSGSEVIVNLAGVTDMQRIVVRLDSVTNNVTTANVDIPMGVLAGDTNGSGIVNSGDAIQTRSNSGQTANLTNFRTDVNASGTVDAGDAILVRARSGNSL